VNINEVGEKERSLMRLLCEWSFRFWGLVIINFLHSDGGKLSSTVYFSSSDFALKYFMKACVVVKDYFVFFV
jgi:hypothetical protein